MYIHICTGLCVCMHVCVCVCVCVCERERETQSMCLRVMQVDKYSTHSQHHYQKHTGDISAHVRMFAVWKVCSKDEESLL